MRKTITADGSITFYSDKYNEHYHSVSGAEEEAVKKFVEPCNIKELIKNNKEINILDICFGLGYNSAAAIDEIRKHSKDIQINIIGLENDKEIINKIKDNNTNFKSYNIIKSAAENLSIKNNNTNIKILLNDAKKSIKNI
ncbi:hypothetical protein KY345_04745, partial [Candidatus Woesearchaeota archaeon]|nr:hypothetical protein [Candidatus Woesearchaeota archaeon]